jgi:hypothetical protein
MLPMTEQTLKIEEDGTLIVTGLELNIPDDWEATGTPGVYACRLPECMHRRYSYRAERGTLVTRFHCFLKQGDCISEECKACPMAERDRGVMQEVTIERIDPDNGRKEVTTEVMKVNQIPNPAFQSRAQSWRVKSDGAKPQPAQEHPVAEKVAVKHGKPRIFADGQIAYPKRGWEPPPVPLGYRRKSDDLRSSDAWVFLPVLPPCDHRKSIITYSACGAAKIRYECALKHNTDPCQTCPEKK